ncbi:MAG: glycosyltransferase family 39 protein [Anaerolineae bacterium]|nr:glycosyltransferase family 39 protein [Anaerolineae bacterium]
MVVADLRWPEPWDWSLVLSPRSPLNPRFFAYGSLPLYILHGLRELLGAERLYLAGRALSAGLSLATVAALHGIGSRLRGRRAGLLAAAFLAVSVLPVQLAHFGTVDSLLVLLCTLAVWALVEVAQTGSLRAGVAGGVLSGLALATKTSALPLVVALWAAWAVWAVQARPLPRLGRGLAGLAISAAAAVVAFAVAMPYALIDWFRFLSALAQEAAMAEGSPQVPYVLQYEGTVPYLYQLVELARWSLGLPLCMAALAGVAWLTWQGARHRRPVEVVILAWVWPYFLAVGAFHAKFMRYMAPLVPWLCLSAALLVVQMGERAQGTRWRWIGPGLAGVVLAPTLVFALAFTGIYLRPHPWVVASEWLCREVPAGATLLIEMWDQPLPAGPPEACAGRYRVVSLDLYASEGSAKLEALLDALEQADYVILASQRQYGAVPRLPGRYPLAFAYYRLLLGERLGFRLVHVTSSYPRLGPLVLVDEPLAGTGLPCPLEEGCQCAGVASWREGELLVHLGRTDESYSVYDHPRTLIFKKQVPLSREKLQALLTGST